MQKRQKNNQESLAAALRLEQLGLRKTLERSRIDPRSFEGQNRAVLTRAHNKRIRQLKRRLARMSS